MRFVDFTTFSLVVSASLASGILGSSIRDTPDYQAVCHQITSVVSNASQVFFPPGTEYDTDNEHAYLSSSEVSACSVEPGSTKDLGQILQILTKARTPFAVKSGGYATNSGFSSTTGVQISLARFNTFKVNTEAQTVELGPSLTWGDAYERLDPYGVTVIGGGIPEVGIGGLILGGGYSYKSNQYGLSIDNVVAYELVLPNGTVTTVTADDQDLWFSLGGGGNNFGIVTKFTVKSHPQDQVWGGNIVYGPDQLGAVKSAISEFSNVTDTSATLVATFFSSPGGVITTIVLFYDGPNAPSGVFDAFLRLPNQQQDINTRFYTDFIKIQNSSSYTPVGSRGHSCGFPTTNYSLTLLDAMTDQVQYWGSQLTPLDQNVSVGAIATPFVSSVYTHGAPSAYPPDRSIVSFPSIMVITWLNSSLDETMTHAIRTSADSLRAVALTDGQDVEHAVVSPNYALFDTPLEDMYGGNVPRLGAVRQVIDPEDVMGLAGGFKF